MDYTRLDELRNELKALRPLDKAEIQRFRDEFAIENTYHSNAIEGNPLTLRETAFIVQEGITIAEKPIRAHLEVIGHHEAFNYVIELADTNTVLTEKVIKDIHSIVLMDNPTNRGKFRDIGVTIVGAKHEPPQPYLVPVQMERLLADYEELKADKHIIEAIAEFHLRFEGIHPFIDGNGRTGRLILNLELIKAGLLPVNIKFADQRNYYDCFDAYYDGERIADVLTEMLIKYEIEELEKHIKRIY